MWNNRNLNTAGGVQNGTNPLEDSLGFFKAENMPTLQPNNSNTKNTLFARKH